MKNRYGKEVLVTGAGSGLGLACAEAFAASGCHVVGVSRSCKEETRKVGAGSIDTMKMDVNDDESIRRVAETMPRVDIVVHCAGFGIAGAAEDTPIDLARAQMETNYFGVLRVNARVLPKMRAQKSGLVLLISSVAGRIGIPFQSHYSSSKFALEAYCEALRMECAPFGIRASLFEPGDTFSIEKSTESGFIPVPEAPCIVQVDMPSGKIGWDWRYYDKEKNEIELESASVFGSY